MRQCPHCGRKFAVTPDEAAIEWLDDPPRTFKIICMPCSERPDMEDITEEVNLPFADFIENLPKLH